LKPCQSGNITRKNLFAFSGYLAFFQAFRLILNFKTVETIAIANRMLAAIHKKESRKGLVEGEVKA
jgi:hypothetical protein